MRALLIKSTLRFMALLPLRVVHACGSTVGYLLWLIPNRSRTVAATNIARCYPDLNQSAQNKLLIQTLKEAGKTALEVGILWLRRKSRLFKLVKKVSGESLFLDALKKPQGIIILAPHLGAWELVGLYCSTFSNMTNLYRPPKIKALDQFIRAARQRFGAKLVPTDASGVRQLYSAVAKQEMIGILPDQDAGRSGSVFAPFFGIQASTMTLLSRLARKSGAQVIIVFAERLPKGKGYHLHFIAAPQDIAHNDPLIAASALNRGIEQSIRTLPAQYQWIYKRFKTRPQGEPNFYP